MAEAPPPQNQPYKPDQPPIRGEDAHDTIQPKGAWTGPTYYGRSQLKSAPFQNWVVGGYIFLAGVSGASALLSAIADVTQGPRARDTARHGRYLALLAPTIGSALLVYDLHTPKRFYNMLRIAKRTSPMSIGTWILMSFSGFAFVSAGAQFASDRKPRWRFMRMVARAAHIPAAIAGAGLSTYTASLLAATSTPLWAAFALLEPRRSRRRSLDQIALAALTAEFAATAVSHAVYRQRGVDEALEGGWGLVEKLGAAAFGTVLPMAIHGASLGLQPRQSRMAARVASIAILAGSLLLRVSMMAAGDKSADEPQISFRFSQPENLPEI
jgi:protein NrfD